MGMPKLSNFEPLVSVCCSRIVVEGTMNLKLVRARSCVESVRFVESEKIIFEIGWICKQDL